MTAVTSRPLTARSVDLAEIAAVVDSAAPDPRAGR